MSAIALRRLAAMCMLAVIVLMSAEDAEGCTSVIVSGKVTKDGRPLMWKNRDTGAKENLVKYFPARDGFHSYVGIASTDRNARSVWIGTNRTGFSIMNTVSYNIKDIADEDKENDNAWIMTMALQRCSSVQDFKNLLDTLPRPLKASANYGVIDAQGGGAYFEVNFTEYFMFDVNDPAAAPDGYLVRSNYSLNGRPVEEGHGHVRWIEADRQVRMALDKKDMTSEYVLENMARDYCNPVLGTDCRSRSYSGEWALEHDIITRYKTTCSVCIQGVRPDEDPSMTTMWTIVGYPGTTPAMPVWEAAGEEGLPQMLKAGNDGRSPLAHHGYILKEKVYSWNMDNLGENKYFHWSMLSNKKGTGYLQKTMSVEKEILAPYRKGLRHWRKEGRPDIGEIKMLNETADRRLWKFIEETV